MPPQPQLTDELKTDHLHTDLKGRSVRGGVVSLVSQGTMFLLQAVSTVVLARLLVPADFGLVAMVIAITGLATAFADFGLSEATVQRNEITHDQVSMLFWINVAIGLGLTLITAGLAPILSWFYREPRLIRLTLVLSSSFLMNGLKVQADALLKRQMRFTALAFRDIACNLVAVPIAIWMAWRSAGYWAVVAVPMISNFVSMVISWVLVKWRPSLPRRGTNVRSMVVFGGNVAASYFIFNLNRNFDNILIGWYWGASPLGLYSRAYNLLMLPVRQLNAPISSVAIPTFSRIHGDPDRFARYYLRITSLMMWISAPLFGFLFVAAKPVIVVLLGAKWGEAAPVFQILAISALGQLLLESTVWLLVSRGQSERLLKLLMIISPIIVASFAIGLPFGINGVALSYASALLAMLPWMLKFTFRGTDLTLRSLGRTLLCPVSVCLVGILISEIVLHLSRVEGVVSQISLAAVGFVVALSLSALVPPVRKEIMSFRSVLSELRPSGRSNWPPELEDTEGNSEVL